MTERTIHDVFDDAFRDELNGTPNVSHPVQFMSAGTDQFAVCTLCAAVVIDDEMWKALHRSNHDLHNAVHDHIETEARRYKSPPRYG